MSSSSPVGLEILLELVHVEDHVQVRVVDSLTCCDPAKMHGVFIPCPAVSEDLGAGHVPPAFPSDEAGFTGAWHSLGLRGCWEFPLTGFSHMW